MAADKVCFSRCCSLRACVMKILFRMNKLFSRKHPNGAERKKDKKSYVNHWKDWQREWNKLNAKVEKFAPLTASLTQVINLVLRDR